MAWIMTGITVASAVGGGVLSYAGSRKAAAAHELQGQENSRAALFEQEQLEVKAGDLEIQAQQIETASAQDEARRRDALTSALETTMALRAGRGVGSGSPTGQAIINSEVTNAETDINTSRTNSAIAADSAKRNAVLTRTGSSLAGRKAQTSLLAGDLASEADTISGYAGIVSGVGKASSVFLPSRRT